MHITTRQNPQRLLVLSLTCGSLAIHTPAAMAMADPLALPADGLVVGGTQLVTANGSVGVGTAAPAGLLEVSGTTTGEVLDQQQTDYNHHADIGAAPADIGTAPAWQSFVPSGDGPLTRLEIRAGNSGGKWSATLRIYKGEGAGGALLHSQTVGGEGYTWHAFTLDKPLLVQAGQRYTWQFAPAGSISVGMSVANIYRDGRNDYRSHTDYAFKTYMIPTRKVVVTAAGRLGVGTAAPDRALTVAGDGRIARNLTVGSSLDVQGPANVAGALAVGGPLTVAAVKPVLITRLENLGNDANVSTGIPAADYHCVAAGWSAAYDVNENGSSVNMVWTYVSGSTWWVRAQFSSHSDRHESPDVDVLCFHVLISTFRGNRELNQPN